MVLMEKRPGAPAGAITVSVASGTFVFDDADNAQVSVSNVAAGDLDENPFLQRVDEPGSYTPPPVFEDVFLADGLLSKKGPNDIPEALDTLQVDFASMRLGFAYELDPLVATVDTTSSLGAPLTGTLRWPDGATGDFTIERDADDSVVSYVITHILSGATTTYTQPDITRDANGSVEVRPALVVS